MSNDTQVAAHMALVDQYAEAFRFRSVGNTVDPLPSRAEVEASARQLSEQPGFVMVPVEPTIEMLNAGDTERPVNWHRMTPIHAGRDHAKRIYAAMLAARPSAPTAVEPDERQPLTDEQIDEMLGEANRGFCIEKEDYFKAVRDTERTHGITARASKGTPL